MGIFTKKEPILEYFGNSLEREISELNNLKAKLNDEGKKIIDNDIRLFNIGYIGEKQIIFELKNSHLPIHIFYDIFLEYEDLKSQIDFIIIGEYRIFVIECKNYLGNIIIDNQGNFIREYNNIKEGIYSPITQNERHMRLFIDKIISRQSVLWKLVSFNFEKIFIPIVVFTNSKNIIKMNYAPKKIKNQIIRSDNLIEFIKENDKGDAKLSKKFIESISTFIKVHAVTKNTKKLEKYSKYICKNSENNSNKNNIKEKLKNYRSTKSRELNIKPYLIFNNEELDNLIASLPRNIEDLKAVKGFGDFKITKYGQDIINIINENL